MGQLILEAPVFDRGVARWVEMDRVVYSDAYPWPIEADGMGASLSRRNESAPGILSTQWAATAPTPGISFDDFELPSILVSPNDRVVSAHSDVLLGVLAGFGNTLRFQWRHNGVPIRDATQSTLLIQKAELLHSGTYDALVMGRGGIDWSGAGQLTVVQAPTLYDLPALPLAVAGTNYFINVGAIGSGSLNYQWKKDGVLLASQTNSSLLLTTVSSETDGKYSVKVMDAIGETESPPLPVHVVYAPQLLWPPESQMVNVGEAIRLRVTVGGTPPFAYLWRKDGLNLRRPSQDTLTIPNAQLTHAGVYSLLISNIATTRFVALPQKANVLVLGDSDGDGMPDIWELTYQLRFDDPSDAAIDSDLDGMTNLEEYRAGTNPLDPSDFVRLDLTLDRTTRFQLSAANLRFTTISNRTYLIQVSDRLDGSWSSWMDLPAQQTNKAFVIPIDVRNGTPQLHYRLRIP